MYNGCLSDMNLYFESAIQAFYLVEPSFTLTSLEASVLIIWFVSFTSFTSLTTVLLSVNPLFVTPFTFALRSTLNFIKTNKKYI